MSVWQCYPPIPAPATVLALAGDAQGLWAGGAGGVARFDAHRGRWQLRIGGLPRSPITSLARAGGWLFAGGADGLARSADGGATWQVADSSGVGDPITALAPAPRFDETTVVLAGTLTGGVLRSEDAGRTWRPSNFGLQNFEVNGLAWRPQREDVLAATGDGVYRSPNGGRAWRTTNGAEGLRVADVAFLDGFRALAAVERGDLLISDDGGSTWSRRASNLPESTCATRLFVVDGRVWLGASNGAFVSDDGGHTWQQLSDVPTLSFAADASAVYLGTTAGVLAVSGSDPTALPMPAVHDLRYLLVANHRPFVAGLLSGLWRWEPASAEHFMDGRWRALAHAPAPLTALAAAPGGALIAAGAEGVMRSTDHGDTWRLCLAWRADQVASAGAAVGWITLGHDDSGWAATGDGSHLWRTADAGVTWQACDSPFGALPVAALQATPIGLIAAAYDARMRCAQLWFSADGGATWQRGAGAKTNWPVIAACAEPPAVTLGDQIFVHEFGGHWGQYAVGADRAGVRRIAADGTTVFALTTTALLRSADAGVSWQPVAHAPPAGEILDLAVSQGKLYVLLTEGRVWFGAV